MEQPPRQISYFADDREAGVSFESFITALQVWSFMRKGNSSVTVAEAAAEFQVSTDVVRSAVKAHYWMYLDGPDDAPECQTIEHEGE